MQLSNTIIENLSLISYYPAFITIPGAAMIVDKHVLGPVKVRRFTVGKNLENPTLQNKVETVVSKESSSDTDMAFISKHLEKLCSLNRQIIFRPFKR